MRAASARVAVGKLSEAMTSLAQGLECRAAIAAQRTARSRSAKRPPRTNPLRFSRFVQRSLVQDNRRRRAPRRRREMAASSGPCLTHRNAFADGVGGRRALEAEGSARERADVLLQIDPVSWSGGPFRVVPIERLLEKAQRAVQAPDSLEKQITLLATEDEARRLGFNDLIAAWSKEGLRYQGVHGRSKPHSTVRRPRI